MKIITKILISTVLSVFIAVISLTVGAAWLNIHQTQDTNKNRLEIAVNSVKEELLQNFQETEAKHFRFFEVQPDLLFHLAYIAERKSSEEIKNDMALFDLLKILISYGTTMGRKKRTN